MPAPWLDTLAGGSAEIRSHTYLYPQEHSRLILAVLGGNAETTFLPELRAESGRKGEGREARFAGTGLQEIGRLGAEQHGGLRRGLFYRRLGDALCAETAAPETLSRAAWRAASQTERSEARRVTNEEGLDSFETAKG